MTDPVEAEGSDKPSISRKRSPKGQVNGKGNDWRVKFKEAVQIQEVYRRRVLKEPSLRKCWLGPLRNVAAKQEMIARSKLWKRNTIFVDSVIMSFIKLQVTGALGGQAAIVGWTCPFASAVFTNPSVSW